MFATEENPAHVNEVDVLVGIPTYKEADSVRFVAEQAGIGLTRYFPEKAAAIVNCDNCSPDGTGRAFMAADTLVPKIYISTPPGTKGKGHNLLNLFQKAMDLNAHAVVCLDGDLTSATPEWIQYLIAPLNDGFDYVMPLYTRHKWDGTITKSICYPLVYGLLCCDLRQPIGGEFALSRRLVQHLLCQPWYHSVLGYGVDIFMSMNAVLGGFKVCEVRLGTKEHKPSAPKLDSIFMQEVSSAFWILIKHLDSWSRFTDVASLPRYGVYEPHGVPDMEIDATQMRLTAQRLFMRYMGTLEKSLSAKVYALLNAEFSENRCNISPELWTEAVYDSIVAFKHSDLLLPPVEALQCIFFGWVSNFVAQTHELNEESTELLVRSQAELFYEKRSELICKLRAADSI